MPMPNLAEGSTWPPRPWNSAYAEWRLQNAWWVGDVGLLQAEYGAMTAKVRPSQLAGGVVGAAARFFWGRAPTQNLQQRHRLHLPLPSDIATASADLLFSEPPRMVLARDEVGDDEGTPDVTSTVAQTTPEQRRLESLFGTNHTRRTLLAAAESQAALGGCYLVIAWDAELEPNGPYLLRVDHDAAIPVFSAGKLRALTCWSQVSNVDQTVIRHLEHHEPGHIYHALYYGTAQTIGSRQPMSAAAGQPWNTSEIDLIPDDVPTGTQRLTAAYIPNRYPQRMWRGIAGLDNFGYSDFSGSEPWFDAIDETYTSWMRDIRLGRARILVPQNMLDSMGPGNGATFDDDKEVFQSLGTAPGKPGDGATLAVQQFAIRWQEHQASIRDFTNVCLRNAGISSQALGSPEPGFGRSVTATEVDDRDSITQRTRDRKAETYKDILPALAVTMAEIDVAMFGGVPTDDGTVRTRLPARPELRFPSEAQIDPLKAAQTASLLHGANAASTQTIVRLIHPEWDGPTVNAEVARITAAAQANTPGLVDPFAIRQTTAAQR